MNGKGSKPRPFSNFTEFQSNYDEINWDSDKEKIVCYNCGGGILVNLIRKKPHLFQQCTDGQVSHINCNFN